MAVVMLKCPHCLGMAQLKVIGLFVVPHTAPKGRGNVSLGTVCPGCHMPVAVLAKRTIGTGGAQDQQFNNAMNGLLNSTAPIESSYLELVDHWPKPPEPQIPDHLPDPVAKAFMQAERNYPLAGHEEAAGLMYRRSLELALGAKYPDYGGNLAGMIKRLVAERVLTEDVGHWATEVRLVGNDAAHALEVTRDDLEMMRGFADAVLRYVWTLPTQVQRRRAAKPPASDTTQ
jgi:Domain of unknown function (DUF4145)